MKTIPSVAEEFCDNEQEKRSANSEALASEKMRELGSSVGGQGGIQVTNHSLSVGLHVTLPLRETDLLIYFLYFYFHKLFTKYVEMRQHKGIFSVVIYRKKN